SWRIRCARSGSPSGPAGAGECTGSSGPIEPFILILGLTPYRVSGTRRRPSRERQDSWAVLGDGDGVLGVRRPGAVDRLQRPAVRRGLVAAATTGHQHRLDREDQAAPQPPPPARPALVGHVRVLVHLAADAVAAEPL